MTSNKIKTILEEYYGISSPFNKWIRFKDITIIYLAQDANIFIGDDQIFYFDTSDNTLNISENSKYISMDLSGKTELDDFPVHTKLSIDAIAGFISTSTRGPYGAYLTKKF